MEVPLRDLWETFWVPKLKTSEPAIDLIAGSRSHYWLVAHTPSPHIIRALRGKLERSANNGTAASGGGLQEATRKTP